jgi:hypothetical protein
MNQSIYHVNSLFAKISPHDIPFSIQSVSIIPGKGGASKLLDNQTIVGYKIGERSGCSSVVERLLPKQNVMGSSPITRSLGEIILAFLIAHNSIYLTFIANP